MEMIRWMCGISMKDRRTNEECRRLVGVQPITTVIRSGRLRWYGHVMRKMNVMKRKSNPIGKRTINR